MAQVGVSETGFDSEGNSFTLRDQRIGPDTPDNNKERYSREIDRAAITTRYVARQGARTNDSAIQHGSGTLDRQSRRGTLDRQSWGDTLDRRFRGGNLDRQSWGGTLDRRSKGSTRDRESLNDSSEPESGVGTQHSGSIRRQGRDRPGSVQFVGRDSVKRDRGMTIIWHNEEGTRDVGLQHEGVIQPDQLGWELRRMQRKLQDYVQRLMADSSSLSQESPLPSAQEQHYREVPDYAGAQHDMPQAGVGDMSLLTSAPQPLVTGPTSWDTVEDTIRPVRSQLLYTEKVLEPLRSSLRADQEKLQQSFEQLRQHHDRLKQEVDQLRQSKQDAEAGGRLEQPDVMAELTRLAQDQAQLLQDNAFLKAELARMKRDRMDGKDIDAILREDIDKLQKQQRDTNRDIASVKRELDQMGKNLDQVKEDHHLAQKELEVGRMEDTIQAKLVRSSLAATPPKSSRGTSSEQTALIPDEVSLAALEVELDSLRQAMTDSNAHLQAQAAEIRTTLTNQVEELVAGLESRLTAGQDRKLAQLQTKVEDVETKLQDDAETRIQELMTELSDSLDNKLANAEQELNRTVENKMLESEVDAAGKLETRLGEISQRLETSITGDVEAQLADMESRLKAENVSKANDLEERLLKDIEIQLMPELKKRMSTELESEIIKEVESKLKTATSNVEASLETSLLQSLESRLMDRIIALFKDMEANISSNLEKSLETKLTNALTESEDRLSTKLYDKLYKNMGGEMDEFNLRLTEEMEKKIMQGLSDLERKMTAELDLKLRGEVEDKLINALDRRLTELNINLNCMLEKRLVELETKQSKSLEAQMVDVESSMTETVKAHMLGTLNTRIQDVEHSLIKEFNETRARMKAELESNIQLGLQPQLREEENRITKELESLMIINLEEKLEELNAILLKETEAKLLVQVEGKLLAEMQKQPLAEKQLLELESRLANILEAQLMARLQERLYIELELSLMSTLEVKLLNRLMGTDTTGTRTERQVKLKAEPKASEWEEKMSMELELLKTEVLTEINRRQMTDLASRTEWEMKIRADVDDLSSQLPIRLEELRNEIHAINVDRNLRKAELDKLTADIDRLKYSMDNNKPTTEMMNDVEERLAKNLEGKLFVVLNKKLEDDIELGLIKERDQLLQLKTELETKIPKELKSRLKREIEIKVKKDMEYRLLSKLTSHIQTELYQLRASKVAEPTDQCGLHLKDDADWRACLKEEITVDVEERLLRQLQTSRVWWPIWHPREEQVQRPARAGLYLSQEASFYLRLLRQKEREQAARGDQLDREAATAEGRESEINGNFLPASQDPPMARSGPTTLDV